MSVLRRIWSTIRTHKWKSIIGLLVFLFVAFIIRAATAPKVPEYVTALAETKDLRQTVEAVGTVISERDLQLQFPTSGIVSQVSVKEGDRVRAGQRLGSLRSNNLAADIAAAAARVQSAEADLRAKQEGNRPEDIAITQADVDNKRSALEASKTSFTTSQAAHANAQIQLDSVKNEAAVSLSGYVTSAGSTVTEQLTVAQNGLSELQGILTQNDVLDAVIKASPAEYDQINVAMQQQQSAIRALYAKANPQDFQTALTVLDSTRAAVTSAWSVLNRAYDMISNLPTTSSFDTTAKEGYKSTLAATRSQLQAAIGVVDSSAKALRDASASFASRISTQQASLDSALGAMNKASADILTYETSLRIAEAQLQLKKAPTRETDIAIAKAAVAQARASLAAASAQFSNTVLTAPIDGLVTKVNIKVGEFTPVGPAVTMVGSSPYRIEMFVSEIDIPKVILTQTGSVELDAFRGTDFALTVGQIDTTSTDVDGVSKYRVKLDFRYPHDELKIGMTGDAEVVTGMKKDVVTVPLRAVIENDKGEKIVRVKDGDEVKEVVVETGMEGEGGEVEIVSGVKEGDIVIVLTK